MLPLWLSPRPPPSDWQQFKTVKTYQASVVPHQPWLSVLTHRPTGIQVRVMLQCTRLCFSVSERAALIKHVCVWWRETNSLNLKPVGSFENMDFYKHKERKPGAKSRKYNKHWLGKRGGGWLQIESGSQDTFRISISYVCFRSPWGEKTGIFSFPSEAIGVNEMLIFPGDDWPKSASRGWRWGDGGGAWFASYKLARNVKQYDRALWHFERTPLPLKMR